jgi:hypothetical protein
VPKIKVARDGAMGERNAVRCGSIEHKMGIHGSPTCVINFDGAQGYLIGQPNKGLMAMFTMMNTARLAVGLQGLAMIDARYQNALAYTRDACRAVAVGAKSPTSRPTRSSCIRTSGACCSLQGARRRRPRARAAGGDAGRHAGVAPTRPRASTPTSCSAS